MYQYYPLLSPTVAPTSPIPSSSSKGTPPAPAPPPSRTRIRKSHCRRHIVLVCSFVAALVGFLFYGGVSSPPTAKLFSSDSGIFRAGSRVFCKSQDDPRSCGSDSHQQASFKPDHSTTTTSTSNYYSRALDTVQRLQSSTIMEYPDTPPASATFPTARDNHAVDLDNIPVLPNNAQLTYLAEGAANVIYRLTFPGTSPSTPPPGNGESADNGSFSSGPDPMYHNRLLRVRKSLPSAQPNLLAYKFLSTTAFPLFPPQLYVDTKLIRVSSTILHREINNLKSLEANGLRPEKRHGLYLETETEEFGFLITDMSPHCVAANPPTDGSPASTSVRTGAAELTREILVEFKPKWVVQSPSAPKNWRRCRTCALRAMKAANNEDKGRGFCPLDLSSGSEPRIRRAVRTLVPSKAPKGFLVKPGSTWEEEKARLEDFIVKFALKSELVPLLKSLQARLDPKGPLEADMSEGGDFLTAMTLRDLTLFLKVDLDGGNIEARVGDLDLKSSAQGKGEYWMGLEKQLIDGGWYTGGDGEGCRGEEGKEGKLGCWFL
ncbi:Inositol-pentakisphosphate 2-kinase [Rhizina undulata]